MNTHDSASSLALTSMASEQRHEGVGTGASENDDVAALCKKHYHADNLRLSESSKCGMSNQMHKTNSEFMHKYTGSDGKEHGKIIGCVGKHKRAKKICASKKANHGETKHFNKDGSRKASGGRSRRRRRRRKSRRKSRKSRRKRRKSRRKRKRSRKRRR